MKNYKLTKENCLMSLNGWKRACIDGLIDAVDEERLEQLIDEHFEKATPKKITFIQDRYFISCKCPICHGDLGMDYSIVYCMSNEKPLIVRTEDSGDYCPHCGQKLDWGL